MIHQKQNEFKFKHNKFIMYFFKSQVNKKKTNYIKNYLNF